jgi:sialate O-acetylesterase
MMRVYAHALQFAGSLLIAAVVAAPAAYAQNAAVAEAPAATKFAVASVFSDHMVLQRDMEVPLWGQAQPGTEVSVKLGDEVKQAKADDNGRWQVELDSRQSGGPHAIVVTAGDDKVTLSDVLIGDVWVAAGQSNMELPVKGVDNAEQEIAAADWPEIRFIDVPHQSADKPRDSFKTGGWQACTPQTIGGMTAVGYFFARDLHKQLHVPIGIVACDFGGTMMESWTSREALESSKTFRPLVESADAPPANEEIAAARLAKPHNNPAALFNGMTSTAIPYAIRGVIWYQGESNAGRHKQYAELSKLMIADWRAHWGQGDFPFLLVQLAGYEKGGDNWPLLREAQADTLEVPNTGMAIAIDVGNRNDVHPKNKQEVGRRLALVARAVAYGEDLVYSGPTYQGLTAKNGKARVAFDQIGKGLKAEGDLKGFEIAGDDGKFVPATATIDGEQVVVSSDAVPEPTQVRYDWAAFPDGNLVNAEGLPAVPFRSSR